MFRKIIIFPILLIAAGCFSYGYKTERKSQFTDINNNSVFVEYAKEKRTEKLPNGAELTFNRKVRVTLPDGERKILFQTISSSGVRYHTPDDQYIFIERGPWCRIIKEGVVVYQGVFRNNCKLN